MAQNYRLSICAAMAALVAAASPALAHHSATPFDLNKTVEVDGTLSDFSWGNPHTLFKVDAAKPGGGTTQYNFEGHPPAFFHRAGFKKEDFQKGVGQKVRAFYSPAKDGSPTGYFRGLIFADGRQLSFTDTAKSLTE
jgi:hypothetical protein